MHPIHKKLISLTMLFALHAGAHASLADHKGHWQGALKVPNGPTLQGGIEVYTRADGATWASLSVIDQLQYDIPVVRIQETGETAQLELPFGVMTMTWRADRFQAEWKQGGETIPLELKKVAQFARKSRPQTPVGPFPYQEEQLAIRSADGVVLGATLTIPDHPRRANLVILVPGSGPQTRDVELAGHRLFAVMADQLARQGIAVLHYDKRGIGRSSGDFINHTQPQLVSDLRAVVRAMKERKAFHRIGLIGHSEGSTIAAAASHGPGGADFIVSLAGPGLPGIPMIELQDRMSAKDKGASPAEVDRMMVYIHRFYETVVAHADVGPRIVALQALYDGLAPDDKAMIAKYKMNQGTLSPEMAKQPFLRVLLMGDVQKDWQAVRCPVLVLNGSVDHQVPVENLDGIVAALHEGGNRKVESAILPSLNHLFQTAATGAEREYATIEETIAPVAIERMGAFIKRQR
jgi:uncharacterized protein